MKETAIEWLVRVLELQTFENINLYSMKAIEQAKEMEKQQIIESYCQGCFDITQDEYIFPRETSEDYYNETFKSK